MAWHEYVFEDPLESLERSQDDYGYNTGKYSNSYSSFVANPLYYFTEVNYKYISSTKKAYRLNIEGVDMWVPKTLLKSWTKSSVYIHTEFYENKLHELDNY